MIKVKTKHGGVSDVIIGEDGHWSFTYVPQSEDDFACIVHSGIPADEVITYLQLEDGTRATHWVPNTVEESELAKLWNSQREIRLNFTNELEQLEGKVQIRTDGILTEFKDLETKTESSIIQTANNIRAEVRDDINRLEGLVNLNAGELTTKFENHEKRTKSWISQTSDNFRMQLDDEIKDVTAQINLNVDRLISRFDDHKRQTSSTVSQSANNLKIEFDDKLKDATAQFNIDVNGLVSKFDDHKRQTSSTVSQSANNLRVQFRNELRDTTSTINANLDELLTEFKNHKEETSTSIAQTDRSIQSRARSAANEAVRTMVPGMIRDEVNSINYSSIIRQQGNNIMLALKGKGGDIINEINMTPGVNRISGKVTEITGNTLIERGVIKDGHIANLNANKITTGTLNAGLVDVVGLSAHKIVGLDSEFVRSRWNNINSNITITGDSLVANHTDGSQTIINAQGLYTRVGNTNYETHYLTHVQNVKGLLHRENSQGQPFRKWVQLPDVFKGKRFKPFVSVSDIYGHQGKVQESSLRLTRFVAYVEWDNIDYANAMVPLVGYASFMNVRSGYHEQHEIAVTLTVLY